MIFGPCQETSKTYITLNLESNFTRQEKNHFLFHWNTLTILNYTNEFGCHARQSHSMTVGRSMDLEISLILGQVSLSLLYWMWNIQTDFCRPGGDWGENNLHPSQIFFWRKTERKLNKGPWSTNRKTSHPWTTSELEGVGPTVGAKPTATPRKRRRTWTRCRQGWSSIYATKCDGRWRES